MDKKISEMFDYGDEIDVTEEINLLFDPEEIKEATMNKIHNSQGEHVRGKKSGRRLLVVAIAAVLVLSMTVGAAAAAGLFGPLSELFAPLFGASESQAAIIERLGQPIGVSDTQGGVTVTAEAAINDGKNLVVLYSVTKDDGSALVPEGTERFDQLAWNAGDDSDLHFAFSQREPNDSLGDFDYTPGDSTARIIQKYTADAGMPDRFTGYLSDLEYWCDGTDGYTEVHRIASGGEKKDDFWHFDFPIVPVNEAATIPADEAEIRISPLALEVQFTVQGHKEVWETPELSLRLKDGRVLDYSSVTDDNGITSPMSVARYDPQNDTTLFTLGGVFDEVIPLDEMDCIVYNGIKYPIK